MAISDHRDEDDIFFDSSPSSAEEQLSNTSQDDLMARGVPGTSVRPATRSNPVRNSPVRRNPVRHNPIRRTGEPNSSPANSTTPLGPPGELDTFLEGYQLNKQLLQINRKSAREAFGRSLPEEALTEMAVPEIEVLIATWQKQMPRQEVISPVGQSPPPPQPTPQQLLEIWTALHPENTDRQGRIQEILEEHVRQNQVFDSFVENVYQAGLGPHPDPNQAFLDLNQPSPQPSTPIKSPPAPSQTPSPQPAPSGPNEQDQEQKNRRGQQQDAVAQRRANQRIQQANAQARRSNHQAALANAQAEASRQQAQATLDYLEASQDRHLSVLNQQLSRFSPEQQAEIVGRVIEEHNQAHPNELIDPKNPSENDLLQLNIPLLAEMGRITSEQHESAIGDVPSPLKQPTPEELEQIRPPEEGGSHLGESQALPGVKPAQPASDGPWNPLPDPAPPEQDQSRESGLGGRQPVVSRQDSSGGDGANEGEEASEPSAEGDEPTQESEGTTFESTGQPIVGRNVSELTEEERSELDQNYQIRTMKDGRQVLARKPHNTSPQLHLDKDGVIQDGPANNRSISDSNRVAKNFEEANDHKKLPEGFEHNHIVPVNKFNSEPLLQEGMKRNPEVVDDADNILGMPSDGAAYDNDSEEVTDLEQKGALAKIIHRGSHPGWDERVQKEVEDKVNELERKYPGKSLEELDDKVILDAVRDVADNLRQELLDYAKQIKQGNLEGLPDYIDSTYNPTDAPTRELPKLSDQPSSPPIAQVLSERSGISQGIRDSFSTLPQSVGEFAQRSASEIIDQPPSVLKQMEGIVNAYKASEPPNITSQHIRQAEQQLNIFKQETKSLNNRRPLDWINKISADFLGVRSSFFNFVGLELKDYRLAQDQLKTTNKKLETLAKVVPRQREKIQHTQEAAKNRLQWEQEPNNQLKAQISRTFSEPSVQNYLHDINNTLSSFRGAKDIAQALNRSPEHIAFLENAEAAYMNGGGIPDDVLTLVSQDVNDHSAMQAQQMVAAQQVAQSQQETTGIELERG